MKILSNCILRHWRFVTPAQSSRLQRLVARFVETMNSSYQKLWVQMTVSDQQRQLLIHLMSREMAVKRGVVTFGQFKSESPARSGFGLFANPGDLFFSVEFCTRGREVLPLSQSIRLYAAQTYAMKGVFDVNSSVRLSAIDNLSKVLPSGSGRERLCSHHCSSVVGNVVLIIFWSTLVLPTYSSVYAFSLLPLSSFFRQNYLIFTSWIL